mgnify:CR=1 FL=1
MAESMQGLHRSHRCTEVSNKNIGETVTVMGWVQTRRNLGSLIFVDLRDRSGLLQIVFDENSVGKEGFDKAYTLRNEYVIAVVGKVEKRSGAVNENLKTGDIEVVASQLRILSSHPQALLSPPHLRLLQVSRILPGLYYRISRRKALRSDPRWVR